MELRHIRYFLMLAEELNFSDAAQKLHITQPPLSRQIKELEEEIGVKLFYRTKRRVELTSAGKIFQKRAKLILEQLEQACVTARLSSTGTEGEFRIGFTGAIQDLIPTLQVYRKKYPKVGIILNHMSTSDQIVALNENKIDIGLISSRIKNEHIEITPLKTMKFVAALPENHPLVSRKTIFLKDLSDETFIMTNRSVGSLYYETFMSVFKQAGFSPNIMIQANDLQTVLALVASNMGVTLTPSPFNYAIGLAQREVADLDLTIEGLLAWRKDNQSEVLAEFLAFFFDYYPS